MKHLFNRRRRSSKVNTKSNATKANDDSTQPQTPRLTSAALEQLENDTTLPLPTYSNSTSNTPPSLLPLPTQPTSLIEISKLLQDNLHIRNIKHHHFITYKNCFMGNELIDYLIEEHIALDRDEGINIGYKLLNGKKYLLRNSGEKVGSGGGSCGIECVSNSILGRGGSCDEFKDGYVLYRFKSRQEKKQKTTTLGGL